jgi:hypothetical protein
VSDGDYSSENFMFFKNAQIQIQIQIQIQFVLSLTHRFLSIIHAL